MSVVVGAVKKVVSTATNWVSRMVEGQPTLDIKPKDRAVIVIILGDRNENGRVDMTIQAHQKTPVGWLRPVDCTGDIPTQEALAIAEEIVTVLPPPANAVGASIVGATLVADHMLQKIATS